MTQRFSLALLLLAAPTLALAQAPAVVPVQGFLTDAAGEPVDGTVSMSFAFYDGVSDDTPVFAETQSVNVDGGFFEVYVGEVASLDLVVFDGGGAAYLGIQVVGDAEMAPRVPLGTVPFAAFAERAGDARTVGGFSPEALAVPSGAILMFGGDTCPDGWTPYAAARGRAIVGSAGVGVEATVGPPLGNREDRAHTHTVDPPSTVTSVAGSHTHTVDPPPFYTEEPFRYTFNYANGPNAGGASRNHIHLVDVPAASTSTSGAHAHSVDIRAVTSTAARTSDVMPYIQLLLCQKM